MKLQLILFTALAVTMFRGTSGRMQQLKLLACVRSSTSDDYSIFPCDKAYDENASPDAARRSCSTVRPNGWWKAFTGIPFIFNKVAIYTGLRRKDDFNFEIHVDNNVCNSYAGRAFANKSLDCSAFGMALKIYSHNNYLFLCDVQVLGFYKDIKIGLRKCKQSSDINSSAGSCEKAIDGNLNQVFYPGFHCSHTGGEATGWWKAETEGPAWINFVQIFNRQDCCADRLTNFTISVDNKVCYRHNGARFTEKMFMCSTYGRVLKIESSKPYLTLCEVIATGKYVYGQLTLVGCSQNYTHFMKNPCEKAYDVSRIPNAAATSCAIVIPSAPWKAFTGLPTVFYKIAIYTEPHRFRNKPVNFTISVDDHVCYTHDGRKFSYETFHCNAFGIALKISSVGLMPLCDVKVFGWFRGQKVTLWMCKQSSKIEQGIGSQIPCEKAIDGNLNQINNPGFRCSRVGGEATGWWKAQIYRRSWVEYVQIYNRQDCCAERLTNFTISVNDDVCYRHDGTIFAEKLFNCYKTGTELKIESGKPYLTLCEVIAIGKSLREK